LQALHQRVIGAGEELQDAVDGRRGGDRVGGVEDGLAGEVVDAGEADRVQGRALYSALVEKARELGLAGATVWRGVEGFGARSRIHTARILRLSEDLPVIVEIVDSEENIRDALPALDALIEAAGGGGLVTLEAAEVIKYTHGGGDAPA